MTWDLLETWRNKLETCTRVTYSHFYHDLLCGPQATRLPWEALNTHQALSPLTALHQAPWCQEDHLAPVLAQWRAAATPTREWVRPTVAALRVPEAQAAALGLQAARLLSIKTSCTNSGLRSWLIRCWRAANRYPSICRWPCRARGPCQGCNSSRCPTCLLLQDLVDQEQVRDRLKQTTTTDLMVSKKGSTSPCFGWWCKIYLLLDRLNIGKCRKSSVFLIDHIGWFFPVKGSETVE